MTLDWGVSRTTFPALKWGPTYAKTLVVGFWPLQVDTYPEPADGSSTVRGKVAVEDGWSTGFHRFLAVTIGSIPPETETMELGPRTGWDTVDGWCDFLEWARAARPIRWVPNAAVPGTYVNCLLQAPWDEAPEPDWAGRRRIRLVLRATDPATYFDTY